MRNFSLAAVFAATSLATLASAQALPAGDGKDVTEKACTACHGIEPIVAIKDDRQGWSDTVDDMVAKGAEISDADKKKIVDYLAKAFPKEAKKIIAEKLATGRASR